MDRNLIYDVGMHKGEDTDFYLKKGFRVIAIEAHPELAAQGAERFPEFIANGKLVIVNKAVGAENGTARFFVNDKRSVWGTLNEDWAARNQHLGAESHVIEVQTTRFEALLQQYGVPYYMKIDIEGSDHLCLEALAKFPDKSHFVSIESDFSSMRATKAEFDLLASLGYDRFKIVNQHTVGQMICPTPPREGSQLAYKFEGGSSGLFGRELPGEWLARSKAIARFRRIVMESKLVGDFGILEPLPREIYKFITYHFLWRGSAWWDTHAMHSSATSGA